MDYDELVAKVIALLQRDKRVPYRSLKRRFDIDDDYIGGNRSRCEPRLVKSSVLDVRSRHGNAPSFTI
jgi:hypothetical protein